jgi:hypothetical protein
LRDLPDRDYARFLIEMQHVTIGYIKDELVTLRFEKLHRLLNRFAGFVVKFTGALLFAAIAAAIHHIISTQIEHALDSWQRQYAALVAFVLIYRMTEGYFEGIFEKGFSAIRAWALNSEAQRLFVDPIMLQEMQAAMADLRASIADEPHEGQS